MADASEIEETKQNAVVSLQKHPFSRRSVEEKRKVKELGLTDLI